jgi:hypothetical protein
MNTTFKSHLIDTIRSKGIKGQKNVLLFTEAYRRKVCLGANNKFLGLGIMSEYKSSTYFKPSFKVVKGYLNWFTLTNEGMQILEDVIKSVHINTEYIDTINRELFN